MDPYTLPLYLIASGFSFCLSLLLIAFAYFQPGTLIVRRAAIAILLLASAYFIAGYGPILPRWMTVLGTNVGLISAAVLLHGGMIAYIGSASPRPDWFGWCIVAATVVPLWYWGLVEPNGVYRSLVFSIAVAFISSRTTFSLLRGQVRHSLREPRTLLGALFGVLTFWMLLRGVYLLISEPVPMAERGTNPTSWITVFGYIILITALVGSVLWLEIRQLKLHRRAADRAGREEHQRLEPARGNLMLLWAIVIILNLVILAEVAILYRALGVTHIITDFQPVLFGAVMMVAVIFAMAAILTALIRQRDDQDRFLAMLNHELKTPLSILRLSLGYEAIPQETRARASRALNDMNGILERCLQADRLSQGRVVAKLSSCSVLACMKEALERTGSQQRFQPDIDETLKCLADPQLLDIILGNLADNAVKYSEPDSDIGVHARKSSHKNKDGVRISFSNKPGIAGMPDPQQVFRKYYRAKGAHGKTGSGLGLHICHALVTRMGGWLCFFPQEKQVVFELWLPA